MRGERERERGYKGLVHSQFMFQGDAEKKERWWESGRSTAAPRRDMHRHAVRGRV